MFQLDFFHPSSFLSVSKNLWTLTRAEKAGSHQLSTALVRVPFLVGNIELLM